MRRVAVILGQPDGGPERTWYFAGSDEDLGSVRAYANEAIRFMRRKKFWMRPVAQLHGRSWRMMRHEPHSGAR